MTIYSVTILMMHILSAQFEWLGRIKSLIYCSLKVSKQRKRSSSKHWAVNRSYSQDVSKYGPRKAILTIGKI